MDPSEDLQARLRAIEMLLEHLLSRESPEYLRRWSDDVLLPAQGRHANEPLLQHLERLLEAAIRMQVSRERVGVPPQGPLRD